ncbi:tetratricopeptide repeat protein [Agrobacterium larrymoorei]|uniref:Tetratricopeptide repeat protein n=1 Tax=Agrobacterium larrymoorei TaxID=160699 RepID=A0ABX8T6I4_9HYPH|nr:tetratricopeptide repeat protein [Agrobacterium larrymoorei]QYA08733.1 hypothetical protein J5285_15000 [Agrobacterium larrymoorei]
MNNPSNEIPDDIYREVVRLSAIGDEHIEIDSPTKAISAWQRALDLLPNPKRVWDASVWLNASIGDAFLQLEDFDSSLSYFREAEVSADGFSNAFVQLGIGVSLYELGNTEQAKEHLLRSYMLEGEQIFSESDMKYLSFLKNEKLI